MLEHRACSPRHRVCSWCERVSDGAHNVGAQGAGNDGPATQASTITALNLLTTNCTSVCARLSVSLSSRSHSILLSLSLSLSLSCARELSLSHSLPSCGVSTLTGAQVGGDSPRGVEGINVKRFAGRVGGPRKRLVLLTARKSH